MRVCVRVCVMIAFFACLVYMCSTWFAPTHIYEKAVVFLGGRYKSEPDTEVL